MVDWLCWCFLPWQDWNYLFAAKMCNFCCNFVTFCDFFCLGSVLLVFSKLTLTFLHFFFKILWEHFKKWHWIDFILHKQVYFFLSCFAFVAIKGSGLAITKPPNKFLHYHINLSTTYAVSLVNLQNGIFDIMSSWKALLRYDCRKVCCASFWDWFCAPLLRTRWVCSIDTVHWLSSVAQ